MNNVKNIIRKIGLNKCNSMLKEIFSDTMAMGDAGADINSYACEFEENSITLHCWDGRRYMLTCTPMANGCAYDPRTGDPVKP